MSARSNLIVAPLAGNVLIQEVRARDGRILREVETHNSVVFFGLDEIMHWLGYPRTHGGRSPLFVGFGTDGEETVDTQTALNAEFIRRPIFRKLPQGHGSILFQAYLAPEEGNGVTYKEAGLFSAPVGGSHFARVEFSGIPKVPDNSLIVSWLMGLVAS